MVDNVPMKNIHETENQSHAVTCERTTIHSKFLFLMFDLKLFGNNN